MNTFFSKYAKGDTGIWIIVLFLSIFSILAVYSSIGALAFRFDQGDTESYLIKHVFILGTGLFLMYFFHNINYSVFSKLSVILYYISIPLLLFTLAKGQTVNDASRWLTVPIIGLSFQTSDFAKLALIMYLARKLTLKQDDIKDWKSGFIPLITPVLLTTVLIFPANLSTALLIFGTSLIIMFVGRVPIKFIAATIGVVVAGLGLIILIMLQMPGQGRVKTWVNRIENFKGGESADNYQAEKAKIAIANGGLFGKLPGNSTQRKTLPQSHSDFIYSIIVEEYGLFIGIFILALYLALMYRGVRIAVRSPGTFGAFLAIGFSIIITFQALSNIAVAVNMIPVTGQPLPLISKGGTSIWFTCIMLGIILSVSRMADKNEENIKNTEDSKNDE